MIRTWLGIALLSGSWLLGLNYFYPASPSGWLLTVAGAVVLLSSAGNGNKRPEDATAPEGQSSVADDAFPPSSVRCRCGWLEVIALILLLPAVWFAFWPYRAAPLLIVLGLALRLVPIGRRWSDMLAHGAVTAGTVMFAQALALELYSSQTACWHDLPAPAADLLAAIASLLGIDAVADGPTVVMHSMRETHRLGVTWELLMDPATWLFLVGGLTMLALKAEAEGPAGQRWRTWLAGARRLVLIVVAWLPLRAGLLMALYLHRVLRSNPDRPLHAMNHFFSPWMLLALLIVPVLLAWRFLGGTRRGRAAKNSELDGAEGTAGEGLAAPSLAVSGLAEGEDKRRPTSVRSEKRKEPGIEPALPPAVADSLPAVRRLSPLAPLLISLAVALFTAAVYWNPVGARREGRVMVVERHSTWEPTTRPYDTTWFGEPSGYNYAAIYEYLAQYYRMSRLLETDKIDDETLSKCDVLVIKIPTARYSPAEVNAVVQFVERGGGLLLIGDHTNFERSATTMNDITRRMGFIFRDDLLFSFNQSPYDETYDMPAAPHPAVQYVPTMDFAVSCSIDPGQSRGRPVIAGTGLWSMGPEYHNENFHPVPQHCAEMRYGAFVQVWAARHGRGRAVAFADSTVFSNFCAFQPGKAEMMLGLIEWLNHDNPPLEPRPWLVLLGLPLLAAGVWMALRATVDGGAATARGDEGNSVGEAAEPPQQGRQYNCQPNASHCPLGAKWLVLLAAGACGWVAASAVVAAAHRWAVPPPKCVRPEACVVIDRTTSTVPLSNGAFIRGKGEGYGLLEQWIARLGCHTVRKEGPEVFTGDADAIVVICPSRSASDEFYEQLTAYVDRGGRLLVIDSPENANSTAHRLLWPFGMSIRRDQPCKGKLTTDAGADMPEADGNEVIGGQPVARLDKVPVAATVRYGKGSVMVVGCGSQWNDKAMGENWMVEPDAALTARYNVLFALLRSILEDEPLKPAAADKPVEERANHVLKESGPAEP